MLFDEAGFEKKGFLFRGGGKKFYACRASYHGYGFCRELIGRTKIGEHAPAQVAGFAHINDAPPGVLVKIDAGG